MATDAAGTSDHLANSQTHTRQKAHVHTPNHTPKLTTPTHPQEPRRIRKPKEPPERDGARDAKRREEGRRIGGGLGGGEGGGVEGEGGGGSLRPRPRRAPRAPGPLPTRRGNCLAKFTYTQTSPPPSVSPSYSNIKNIFDKFISFRPPSWCSSVFVLFRRLVTSPQPLHGPPPASSICVLGFSPEFPVSRCETKNSREKWKGWGAESGRNAISRVISQEDGRECTRNIENAIE